MFNPDDMSRWGNSDFGDGSDSGGELKASSQMLDNNQEKSRQFIENFELLEAVSIGCHSSMWKVRSKQSL
jgi:hypothetical protein